METSKEVVKIVHNMPKQVCLHLCCDLLLHWVLHFYQVTKISVSQTILHYDMQRHLSLCYLIIAFFGLFPGNFMAKQEGWTCKEVSSGSQEKGLRCMMQPYWRYRSDQFKDTPPLHESNYHSQPVWFISHGDSNFKRLFLYAPYIGIVFFPLLYIQFTVSFFKMRIQKTI